MSKLSREQLRARIDHIDAAADRTYDAGSISGEANLVLARAILTSCLVNLEHMESAERSSGVIEGQGAQLLQQFDPTAWLEESSRLAWALANMRDHRLPSAADVLEAAGLIERLRAMRG